MIKSKTVPLNFWVTFQKELEEAGWKIRGYSEYIGTGKEAVPNYIEIYMGCQHDEWGQGHCADMSCHNYINKFPVTKIELL